VTGDIFNSFINFDGFLPQNLVKVHFLLFAGAVFSLIFFFDVK
jgi:hypothetical protein